jgi:hypothetical protein
MPSSTLRHESFSWGRRLAALWIGVLAGPVAWAALLETNYVLSYVACEQPALSGAEGRHTWMLHLATVVALAIVAAAALAAWRAAPPLEDGADDEPSIDPAETAVSRARFMARAGLALCAWFAIVILATEIPVLVVKPCTP